MKIMTILGTRPEIIRLSLVIEKLDKLAGEHIVVHTGQNYDRSLSDVFFEEMNIRKPDYHIHLGSHSFGRQVGMIFSEVEHIITTKKPDGILVLGDTNSSLCAILGERMGIPVYHMEAGNRCFDPLVPEEMNRKIIDSISSFNLPYTKTSRENLLNEGIHPSRIWVSGNPIYEVLQHYQEHVNKSEILKNMNLQCGKYILVTAHRAENVDNENRLRHIMQGLQLVAKEHNFPIICSIHPRTKDRLSRFGIVVNESLIQLCSPFGFFDFVHLQKKAACVVTDSGTVQEESCIFGVPSVTIRQSTERPETILCGSNIIAGTDSQRIADCVRLMLNVNHSWKVPEGYDDPIVSAKIANFILGGLSYV